MAIQTYTVELKIDGDDEQHAAMTEAMKQLARNMLTVGMLMSNRKPLIICRTTDAFYDTAEIELMPTDE
jgi:hypothetical protein